MNALLSDGTGEDLAGYLSLELFEGLPEVTRAILWVRKPFIIVWFTCNIYSCLLIFMIILKMFFLPLSRC